MGQFLVSFRFCSQIGGVSILGGILHAQTDFVPWSSVRWLGRLLFYRQNFYPHNIVHGNNIFDLFYLHTGQLGYMNQAAHPVVIGKIYETSIRFDPRDFAFLDGSFVRYTGVPGMMATFLVVPWYRTALLVFVLI